MMNAFKYVRENDGIDTEESYPYEGYQAQCRYSNESRGATAYDAKLLPWGDELQLQAAVASIGLISAAINSELKRFHKKSVKYTMS
uniref:Pept_C1 domain-containing protein n=1 Tax=Loa loa TaxID=7209 RepID=A0A1I7VDJ4_LOALO